MFQAKTTRSVPSKNKTGRLKTLVWIGVAGLALLTTGLLLWKRHFHSYTPLDALKDLRAGAQAGHSPHPARQFLELRYGPQTDPANREKAFKDLFNVGHIEGLYLIVGNRTDDKTKKLVGDVAQIITDYRKTMSPAEKANLEDYFNSDAGRAQVHEATSTYQSKDARFRSVATPVIQELLTTLTALQQ